MASVEQDFNAISVALAAEATFVARSVDRNTKHMAEILKRATEHRGTSFVEIYQNCNIYNDGAFFFATEADVKDDQTVILEHGQPIIFGKDRDKGIRVNGLAPEVVTLGKWRVGKRLAHTRRNPGQSSPCVFAQPPHASGLSRATRCIPLCRTPNL